jgi:hypothetical protein
MPEIRLIVECRASGRPPGWVANGHIASRHVE